MGSIDNTVEIDLFSDLYKDTYGHRPHGHRFYDEDITHQEQQEIWNDTCEALNRELIRVEEAETYAIKEFEDLITNNINIGASDRKTAIKWLFEAEKFNEYDCCYGGSYACYIFNLPTSYKDEFTEIMNNMFVASKI